MSSPITPTATRLRPTPPSPLGRLLVPEEPRQVPVARPKAGRTQARPKARRAPARHAARWRPWPHGAQLASREESLWALPVLLVLVVGVPRPYVLPVALAILLALVLRLLLRAVLPVGPPLLSVAVSAAHVQRRGPRASGRNRAAHALRS